MAYRIYLAEDDPDDVYLIQMAFNEAGHEVELSCFSDGRHLMQAMTRPDGAELPNLILLDLNLPVMDGKATLRSIKEHAQIQSIPVVVYTTSKSERDIEEVYSLGANSYMVKSPDYGELVDKVKCLCDYWFATVELKGRG